MKIVMLAIIAAAVSSPVAAEVYKCQEGGKTVYSQMPCASDAKPMDLKVDRPSDADRLRAKAQSRRERAFNAEVDRERAEGEARNREAADEIQAGKDAKAKKCADYEAEVARLEGTKDKWVSPALRQQDHDRIRELKSALFSECFAR